MGTTPQMLIVEKPTWSEKHFALLCGIANSGGGVLILTYPDRSKKSNFHDMRKYFASFENATQYHLGISCTAELIDHDGSMCWAIDIPSATKPISYKGKYRFYQDGRNLIKGRKDISSFLSQAHKPSSSWETEIRKESSLSDTETFMTANIIEKLSEHLGSLMNHAYSDNVSSDILASYHLKDDMSDALTNAGILLLNESPEHFIPSAYIRIGLFDSAEYSILQQETITGTILDQLECAIDAIYKRFLPKAASQGRQMKTPPPHAILEALRNSLVHRDYQHLSPIAISVFPDHLTIENPGLPPEGWIESDLLAHHSSIPNNPILANALCAIGELNCWGNGIASIFGACSKAGISKPNFHLRDNRTIVTFPFYPSSDTNESTAAHSESISRVNTGSSLIELPVNGFDGYLTNNDEYVLKALAANGRITAIDVAKFLGISESTVRRSFRKLRDLGIVERVGSNKAGFWKVSDSAVANDALPLSSSKRNSIGQL